MIQSGGILGDFTTSNVSNRKRRIKKGISLAPKLAGKAAEYYINKGTNEPDKKFTLSKGLGITLPNNEIKDIMKVISSLENRGILVKGTTRKITNQEGGFLNFFWPLMAAGLPLVKSVLAPLAKSVLLPLRLSAGISATDATIQKKVYGSKSRTLIISNEEIEEVMKIVKLLEESGLLIQGISETIKNETKEKKGGFLSMLLGTLAASVLGSALTGRGIIRAGEGTIRAGENF